MLCSAPDPRQCENIAKIDAAGVALLRLIKGILDFSKNEESKLARKA